MPKYIDISAYIFQAIEIEYVQQIQISAEWLLGALQPFATGSTRP